MNIRNTENGFIQLLSDHIAGRESEASTVSEEQLLLANTHQVAPIIYYQTKEKALQSSYLAAVSAYVQRKALLKQMEEVLSDIPFYYVKGMAVADYYPVPQLRTMGDSDILVHECDKEKVRERLLALGFDDQTSEWDSAEWIFWKNGLEIEVHHRLLYDNAANSEQEKAFADTAWSYVKDHELEVNFHFVYVLLHLKRHMLNQGVGIRQFMDLAVMSKNAGLDCESLSVFLHKAGIEKFAGVCSALCLRWFGIQFPIDTPEISDEFYEQSTETILANGVFGFEVPYDENKRMLNNISRSGKMRSIIEHIFPSYKACCITPKYRWIKGKPYLLPALWIYRFFWALFNGKSKASTEYILAVAGSNKAMDERNRELSAWGL